MNVGLVIENSLSYKNNVFFNQERAVFVDCISRWSNLMFETSRGLDVFFVKIKGVVFLNQTNLCHCRSVQTYHDLDPPRRFWSSFNNTWHTHRLSRKWIFTKTPNVTLTNFTFTEKYNSEGPESLGWFAENESISECCFHTWTSTDKKPSFSAFRIISSCQSYSRQFDNCVKFDLSKITLPSSHITFLASTDKMICCWKHRQD